MIVSLLVYHNCSLISIVLPPLKVLKKELFLTPWGLVLHELRELTLIGDLPESSKGAQARADSACRADS
jgi:hypothetical protein